MGLNIVFTGLVFFMLSIVLIQICPKDMRKLPAFAIISLASMFGGGIIFIIVGSIMKIWGF